MKIEDIKIKDIEIIENVRISVKDRSLIELMESVKQHGLLQPIGVGKEKTGKYALVYGHRRLTACKKLGWVTIPAIVEDLKELQDHMIINVTENLQRKENSPLEIGRICNRLMTETDMTLAELVARLNVSKTLLQGCIDTYNLVPRELRDKVKFMASVGGNSKKGEIPASFVQVIMSLKRTHSIPLDIVNQLLRMSQTNKMSVSDLGTLSRLLKSGLSPADAVEGLKKYVYLRIDILVEKDEVEAISQKHDVSYSQGIAKIVYGEEKSVKRPDFFQTSRPLSRGGKNNE